MFFCSILKNFTVMKLLIFELFTIDTTICSYYTHENRRIDQKLSKKKQIFFRIQKKFQNSYLEFSETFHFLKFRKGTTFGLTLTPYGTPFGLQISNFKTIGGPLWRNFFSKGGPFVFFKK